MIRTKIHLYLLFFSLMSTFPALAYERDAAYSGGDILDSEVAAVYGKACEKIREEEPKSSTRVRVIDKATYIAAEGLGMLDNFRKSADPHNFDLLIYDLIDNSIEDLSVRTLRQDGNGICVEVTGYVIKKDVINGLKKIEMKTAEAQDEIPDELKTTSNDLPTVTSVTEETLAETSQKDAINKPINTPVNRKINLQLNLPVGNLNPGDEDVAEQPEDIKTPQVISDGYAHIFIEPTAFYNKTSSQKFADIIAKQFENMTGIKIDSSKGNAEYIIRSNVLKAKVDPINSNTNRLQMVVSVELEDRQGTRISSEHQNRFVLFSSEDDEQEVALRLMRKLFENACERIAKKIEIPQNEIGTMNKESNSLPSIITPDGQN